MPKNYHTATAPCGTILKRTSESKVYSHCVAVRRNYDAALEHYSNSEFYRDRDNFIYRQEQLKGTRSIPNYITDAPTYLKNLEDQNKGFQDVEAFVRAMVDERVERVKDQRNKGYFDTYSAYGWNGRLDLAEKLKRSCSANTWYSDVVILKATMVTK